MTNNFNKTTSSQFLSLADLTNNHLNKVGAQNRPLFGRKLSGDKDIALISKTLSDTSLTSPPKELNLHISKSEGIENDWHIDLSKALRLSGKTQPITAKTSECVENPESFVIPFIECDVETPRPSLPLHTCNFDIRSEADQGAHNFKKPSKFARALCRQYYRSKPYQIISSEEQMYKRVKRFSFDIPSPDDIIRKHLDNARKAHGFASWDCICLLLHLPFYWATRNLRWSKFWWSLVFFCFIVLYLYLYLSSESWVLWF